MLSSWESTSPSLLILEQYRAEELLTEHLAEQGVEIERKCELKDFKSDDSGVVATVSRKRMLETWNCRYSSLKIGATVRRAFS